MLALAGTTSQTKLICYKNTYNYAKKHNGEGLYEQYLWQNVIKFKFLSITHEEQNGMHLRWQICSFYLIWLRQMAAKFSFDSYK